MYNYLIYLAPERKKSLPELLEDLRDHFAGKKSSPDTFQLIDGKITLRYGSYSFYIHENQHDYVREEYEELNGNFEGKDFAGNDIDAQKFSSAVSRFELHGDADFDMDYFNESLFLIGFFEKDTMYLIFETN